MKILIVDDEEMVVRTIEKKLSYFGYTIKTSLDGFDAHKILEKEDFDLIISDIAMPFLSGFELLSYLKDNLKRETPVILISAMDQNEISLAALKSGASDFITKPINLDELSIKVGAFLKSFEYDTRFLNKSKILKAENTRNFLKEHEKLN